MTPTKETHIYMGMWRPPFETVFKTLKDEEDQCIVQRTPNEQWPRKTCHCGNALQVWVQNKICLGVHKKEIFACWLAGHFDEPVYEKKKLETRSGTAYDEDRFP